jgi:anti-anti-sigma factor
VPSDDSTHLARDTQPTPPEIVVEFRAARAPGFAAIVSLVGEHDLSTSPELLATLGPIAGNVLLDLSACEFIDSTVIGVVIGKSADLARDGHRLELVAPSANTIVTRVIDVVGLRRLMPVHAQVPTAASNDSGETVASA